jgi:hypothetical protein
MTPTPRVTLRRVRLSDLSNTQRRDLTERASTATPEIRARARAIVEAVRDGDDGALRGRPARLGGGPRTRR